MATPQPRKASGSRHVSAQTNDKRVELALRLSQAEETSRLRPLLMLRARRPATSRHAPPLLQMSAPGPHLPPPPLILLLVVAAACSCGRAAGAGAGGGGGSCELSVERGGELYSFALAAPTPGHRHGVLSENGSYKVAVNDSVLWFQLCDEMLFNVDPPVCLHCEECGGPLRCGTQCSALVSNNIGGYDVCTTIGSLSKSHINLIDESNPQKGVIVKMFSSTCSISVSILCDSTVAQVPDKFVVSGRCDYATTLKHPSGCARSVSTSGSFWGWLNTLIITILCLLGGYILIGGVYRYYFLGIHSVEGWRAGG